VAQVFLSYRISDSAGQAGRLADALRSVFGRQAVFLAADDIAQGAQWREELLSQLRSSSVVLAVIGPTWATVADADGRTRLAREDDVVRFEIREALVQGRPVVPVLVGEATTIPSAVPDDVRPLLTRNISRLRDDHWKSDVAALVDGLIRLHPSLRVRYWGWRLVSWRLTLGILATLGFGIFTGQLLLVRLDLLDADTLHLLPPALGFVSVVVLAMHFFVRRAR
jgi:hypothetical protein